MFFFIRISLVLEVNKTVVVCYMHTTNEERKGNCTVGIKWALMKACLGNWLISKDTIGVFAFPCWKRFPIVMSCCFQNVFEMVVKRSGSGRM